MQSSVSDHAGALTMGGRLGPTTGRPSRCSINAPAACAPAWPSALKKVSRNGWASPLQSPWRLLAYWTNSSICASGIKGLRAKKEGVERDFYSTQGQGRRRKPAGGCLWNIGDASERSRTQRHQSTWR